MKKNLLFCVAAMSLASCGEGAREVAMTGAASSVIDDTASAIIGGTSDHGDSAVVALFAAQPGGDGSGSLCTATVISPTVLLTAAHCVAPSEVGAGAQFIAIRASDINEATAANTMAVKETHYDTAFDVNDLNGGHDVGIAILAAPTSLTPLPINRTIDASTLSGSAVRLVGYGVNDGAAQSGAGIKRSVQTVIDDVSAKLLQIGSSTKGTCQGDSGGPALATIDGVETLVGMTSFGAQGCSDGGYDTRVDLYLAFIDKYVGGDSGASTSTSTSSGAEREPNDDAVSANALDSGAITGALSSKTDVDWIKFSVGENASYVVDLQAAKSTATFRLYKRAASGELSIVGDADASHELSRATRAGGDYYAKIFDASGVTGGYSLSVEMP